MDIKVSYMSGAGNTFTIIDNRKYALDNEFCAKNAPMLCSGELANSMRTEGLILIEEGNKLCDFTARFYNPDGSTGMMCGNGGRCAIKFADIHGFIKKKGAKIKFSMAGEYYNGIRAEKPTIVFPKHKEIKLNIDLSVDGQFITGDYINVNSDHFVVELPGMSPDDFRTMAIDTLGKGIRSHANFIPRGVNVNFCTTVGNTVYLRTYERGVEAETGACGTGAISTALSLYAQGRIKMPVKIIPTSAIPLQVDFEMKDGLLDKILLTGHAEVIKDNTVSIDN